MTLFTVAIAGTTDPIEVYNGLPAVEDYLNAAIGDGATAWRALTTGSDDHKRILVAATRYFDSLFWQGDADAQGGTTLQWPRSGITLDGVPVDPATVPAAISKGINELCALIADDPDVLTQADSGSNIRSMQAGSANLVFFRPTSPGDGNATVLPTVLNRLVGRYLASASAAIAAATAGVSTGVSRRSDFGCWCNASPCSCDGGRNNRLWPL